MHRWMVGWLDGWLEGGRALALVPPQFTLSVSLAAAYNVRMAGREEVEQTRENERE